MPPNFVSRWSSSLSPAIRAVGAPFTSENVTKGRGMRHLSSVILLVSLSGCAGMTTTTIKPRVAGTLQCDTTSKRTYCDGEKDAKGFRYFQEAPFLFVHSDGSGGVAGEIVWLPDTTKKMSIRPYAFLATNKTSLSFTNGMLTESSMTADETVIPSAVLTAIVAAFGKGGGDSLAGAQIPIPYLYKITFNAATGEATLTGGYAKTSSGTALVIRVTVPAAGDSP